MQHCSCTVRLGGQLTQTVRRRKASVAEVAILREIHGQDAVVDVRLNGGNDKTPHKQEFDRLVNLYGEPVVKGLFPGLSPKLPGTFREIGIEIGGAFAAEAEPQDEAA